MTVDDLVNNFNNMNTYVVIEYNDNFVICHGSGLTIEEATYVLFINFMNDKKDNEITDIDISDSLEANDEGYMMSYYINENKTTYYILQEPRKEKTNG